MAHLHNDEIRAHGLGILMADPIPEPKPEPTLDQMHWQMQRLEKKNKFLRQAIEHLRDRLKSGKKGGETTIG